MPIDPDDVREHYALLTDEELLLIERNDLTPVAQEILDAELSSRNLSPDGLNSSGAADDEESDWSGFSSSEALDGGESDEDWEENGFPASVFSSTASGASSAAEARDALLAAGVPCAISEREIDPDDEPRDSRGPHKEYWVMVPPAFSLKATSVLDKAIHNPAMEADWKTQLASLSDEELRSMDLDDICSGLLDLAERLRKAYKSEVARRPKIQTS